MAYLYNIVVIVLFCYVGYGNAIKCWTCSSDLDPQCADPFNHTTPRFNLHHTLTDCNTQSGPSYPFLRGKSVCKKIVQIVNGEHTVIRTCAWLQNEDDTIGDCPPSTTPSYIKVEFCETCETEACNSSFMNTSTLWKVFIPFLFTLFLRK